MSSRLVLRFLSNFKRLHLHYDSPSTSNDKICRAFVISSHHYGSFRPTHGPSPLLPRSDSLFSTNQEQTISRQTLSSVSQANANQTSLLEHYLKTYNPLKIDLKAPTEQPIVISTMTSTINDQAQSDTDTRPISNCYAFHCTNQRKVYHGERYSRLKEEPCSATASTADDRLSECSTKLTSTTLPIVMVTDCSDSQHLHTDIIELDDHGKEK
jgi:hypothetical protein